MRDPRLWLLFLAALSACGTVRFAQVGEPLPARAPNCLVCFEHLTPQQAFSQGEREVASGRAAGSGDDADDTHPATYSGFTQDMKTDVAPRACLLGGDLVIVTGTCSEATGDADFYGEATPAVELMVLAKPGS